MSKYIAFYMYRGHLNIDVRLPVKRYFEAFRTFFKTFEPVEG